MKNISKRNYILTSVTILIFFKIFLISSFVKGQSISNNSLFNSFTFTLKSQAVTSAGVYSKDSVLIRTLWSLIHYEAGSYSYTWDGKDDLGNQMPLGTYLVKVASNNVTYNWNGVIGNTSTNNTGSSVHRAQYYFMTGMTFTDSAAYYCSGYSEARPSVYKFFTEKPQEKIDIEGYNTTTANTDIVVNDGKIVYWAGYDPYAPATSNVSWVFGSNISNDSDVNFSGGLQFKPINARAYNTIGLINQANSIITGLAVQRNGKFLFIARAGMNNLFVLDKKTGDILQTLTIKAPKSLCVDMNDNLWMVSDSNTVSKYNVNQDGTITSLGIIISDVLKPIALAVSPDNNTITIADGDLSRQIIRGYNNLNGNSLWTLGYAGGYIYDPTVNNNKFYFNDVRGKMYQEGADGFLVFIAYQKDGSFWVNDPGNYRVQHYDYKRNYLGNIMSLGPTYSTWADRNDISRVGAGFLEFKVDTTGVINGTKGWQLVKNWGAVIPATYDQFSKFSSINTFFSGGIQKTFGFLRNLGANNDVLYEVVELPPGNKPLRFTRIIKESGTIAKNGAFLTDGLKRYAFKGIDSNGNPSWSNIPVILADISQLNDKCPIPTEAFRSDYVTSSGKVIFYNYSTDNSLGFHLGAIKQGGNSWLWKTNKATTVDYSGPFPNPSYFDIGNMVNNNAGSLAMVVDSSIITGYHGENWKQGQTNKFNHYLDNGLAVGQFGSAKGEFVADFEAPPMMAGNTLSPQVTRGSNDDQLYLWHGDESYHAGLHKWTISGLKTILVQNIPLIYSSIKVDSNLIGIDLMNGLIYNSTVQNNLFGWTRLNAEDLTDRYSKYWTVLTGQKAYDNVDVSILYRQNIGNYNVDRTLGNNKNLSTWNLSGKLNMEGNTPNAQNGGGGSDIEVLDDSGKIISKFYTYETYTNNLDHLVHIQANEKSISSSTPDSVGSITNTTQPFEINYQGGEIIFKYSNYPPVTSIKTVDVLANAQNPAIMRVHFWTNIPGENYDRIVDLQLFKFTANKIAQTITFNSIPGKKYANSPFTLTGISTSNLPISYTIISGPAQISGNILTITGTGPVFVRADQPGNEIYDAAKSVIQTFALIPLRIDL